MSKHEMICTCDIDGLRQAEALRLEVQQRLKVKAEQLPTAVLLSLSWHLGFWVKVYVDQWFGVSVGFGDDSEYVECDSPLDGMCFLWKLFVDLHPDRLTLVGTEDNNDETKIQALEKAKDTSKTHKETCSMCGKGELCPVGGTLWKEYTKAALSIDDTWGMPNDAYALYGLPYPTDQERESNETD